MIILYQFYMSSNICNICHHHIIIVNTCAWKRLCKLTMGSSYLRIGISDILRCRVYEKLVVKRSCSMIYCFRQVETLRINAANIISGTLPPLQSVSEPGGDSLTLHSCRLSLTFFIFYVSTCCGWRDRYVL